MAIAVFKQPIPYLPAYITLLLDVPLLSNLPSLHSGQSVFVFTIPVLFLVSYWLNALLCPVFSGGWSTVVLDVVEVLLVLHILPLPPPLPVITLVSFITWNDKKNLLTAQ
jgi:hypothetical protein